MNSFDRAIANIDNINIDNEIKPIWIEIMPKLSYFFDKHNEITIDFDELFDNYLFQKTQIKLIDSDSDIIAQDAGGEFRYNNGNPIIYIRKNDEKFLQHTLIHEFIHFIVHCSHKDNLMSWADEMLTETTTTMIDGSFYGQYGGLITLRERLEKYVEPIKIADFFNGTFDDYLNRNKIYLDIIEPKYFKAKDASYLFLSIISKHYFSCPVVDYNKWLDETIEITGGHIAMLGSYWGQFSQVLSNQIAQNSHFYKNIDTSHLINSIKNYHFLYDIEKSGYSPDKIITISNNKTKKFYALAKCGDNVIVIQENALSHGYYVCNYGQPITIDEHNIILDKNKQAYDLSKFKLDKNYAIQNFKADKNAVILDIVNEIDMQNKIGKKMDETLATAQFYEFPSQNCEKIFDEINRYIIESDFRKDFVIGKIKNEQEFNDNLDAVATRNVISQFHAYHNLDNCATISNPSNLQKELAQYIQNGDFKIGDCIEIAKTSWSSDIPILQAKITENGILIQPHYFYYDYDIGKESAKLYKQNLAQKIRNELQAHNDRQILDNLYKKIK